MSTQSTVDPSPGPEARAKWWQLPALAVRALLHPKTLMAKIINLAILAAGLQALLEIIDRF